jgi:hypothetical protein
LDLAIRFGFILCYECISSVYIMSNLPIRVFFNFLISAVPCGGVRLRFGRKMKVDEDTLRIDGSTHYFALIPHLMLLLLGTLSFVMKKSPTSSRNRCFRYPAPFQALAKCWAKHLYPSIVAYSRQFFKGYRMNKHLERFNTSTMELQAS